MTSKPELEPKPEQEKPIDEQIKVEETPEIPLEPTSAPAPTLTSTPAEMGLPSEVASKVLENVVKASGKLLESLAISMGATPEEAVEVAFSDPEVKAIVIAFGEDLNKLPPWVLKVLIIVPILAKRGIIFMKLRGRKKEAGGIKVGQTPEIKPESEPKQ